MSSQAPTINWITASIPKSGNSLAENEDAAAHSPDGLRFAVCDGASEAWESGPWARHLAATYVAVPPILAKFPEWVDGVRREWKEPELPEPTAWYVEEKRSQGSFATLLGLEFRRSRKKGRWLWRAMAVGDSCLIQVRSAAILRAIPLNNKNAFGNRPALVPSSPIWKYPPLVCCIGRALPGDLMLLATDAVAATLLAIAGQPEWSLLLQAFEKSIHTSDTASLVEVLRAFQSSTNDDMTLTAIEVPAIEETYEVADVARVQ